MDVPGGAVKTDICHTLEIRIKDQNIQETWNLQF